jgi:hypothetical protein
MSRTLTATDRKALIRLASTMGKGSVERRVILAGLKKRAKKRWEVSLNFDTHGFEDNHPEDGEPNPWVWAYITANERNILLELGREDGVNEHHEIRAKWDRRQTPEEQEESARDLLEEMKEELERGDIPHHPYDFSRLF